MGQTNVWMDLFNLHDDLQNEIYRRFNAHLHFPFNYITWGWQIHHKQSKQQQQQQQYIYLKKYKVYNTSCPANSYNANLGRTRL